MLPPNLSVHIVAEDICLRIAGKCMGVQDSSRTLSLGTIPTEAISSSDLIDLWVILICIKTRMRIIASILVTTKEK